MTSPTDAPIKINVYRVVDGIRTPFTLGLDNMRNVLFDEVDTKELARIKASPHLLARHTVGQKADPADRKSAALLAGLNRHVTEKGVVLSREPLDSWEQDFELWISVDSPNPFPETDRLRNEFLSAYADISRRVEAGDCPGCELNRLQVDYRIKLRKLQGL